MLISNKFVFIHIPKVAGSSIQKALAPHVSRPTRKHRDKQYSDHITLKQLKKRANVSHKFTFAFVRNPWGWAQSLYHYVIQYGDGRGWQGNIPSYTKKGMSAWIVKDMERWIKKRTNWHTSNKIFQQSDWISPKVDFIGRYEHLTQDFNEVCRELGIKCTLPHKLKSDHPHYSVQYTEEAIQTVETLFDRDIDKYQYNFERP